MVVMGNPPYAGVSSNNGAWITSLVNDYKHEPGTNQPLQERKQWLNDDYVKFLRLAEHYIARNGHGIVAYINNNGFVDNPTFRGMRWHLLKTFDEIYVLNLHGNSTKKETAPDGTKDENVFDITVGTSINIFVKRDGGHAGRVTLPDLAAQPTPPHTPLATVHYADLYGRREDKYAFLESHALEDVGFQTVAPTAPFYFFCPKNEDGREEYEQGFKLDERMPLTTSGFVSANDIVNISFSKTEQQKKIDDLIQMSESDWRTKYGRPKDSRDWTWATARDDAMKHPDCAASVCYRPFDIRHTIYTGNSRGLYSSPQQNVMSQFLRGANIGLCAIRISSRDNHCATFVCDGITDKTILSSKDNSNVFPLYLYSENMGVLEKRPNFDPEIYAKIRAAAGEATPEDVFNYIYGVLHTPSYRAKYAEFLKVDFPRIPYPASADEFRRIAAIGAELVAVHLLKSPKLADMFAPEAVFPVAGSNYVEAVKYQDGRVSINAGQYFDNIPETAWNAFIGGYQPAQKWLKDRKGRTLAADDVLHYKAIILALIETTKLTARL